MRNSRIIVVVAAVLVLAACRGHETITGGYGVQGVAGVVTMAAGMPNSSPAGVRVAVGGTGMSAVLGPDGRFSFFNVPETADLIFSRDDVDARVRVSPSLAPLPIELSSHSARVGRQRSAPTGPQLQVEGLIVSVNSTQIVVHDEHGNDVTMVINTDTIIRKGDQALTPAGLNVGDRVHVKASVSGNTKTALLIILQNPDDGEQSLEVEGLIVSVNSTQIVVHDSHGNDVTMVIDGDTIIRKGDQALTPSGLNVGDRVHVKASVSGNTKTAILIILQNPADDGGDQGSQTMTANGTVTAAGSSLTVSTEAHGDVVVNVDGSTIIKKQDASITISDIHLGDEVNCMGTRVDDHTLLAQQIEVRGVSGH